MNTQALRQKILDLAIRGKLVPQDPNDEPASVLLERIRTEKQQMVKDGKLKTKDIKNDTIIFKGEDNLHYEKFHDGTVKCIEDEIPFEIPEGWVWTRICNIATVKGGKRIPKGMTFSNKETNHAYIRVIDMKNDTVNLSKLKYIDDNVFDAIQNYIVSKDDLYITIAGTIGVVGEIPLELDGMNLTENAAKISAIEIEKSYLCLVLQSAYCQKQFHQKTYQVAMPKLGLERICSTLIPMCSLKTQKQILEYAKTALSSVNFIEKSKNSLADSILCTKSKILDLAIRGKLVPQDPNEEPASVLLERIQAEKEELIKQGKIKRDKNDSIIFKGDDNSYYEQFADGRIENIEDEIPYYLPEGWEWCRVSTICLINPRNQLDDGADVSFVPMPNICEGYSNSHSSDIRKWGKVKSGYTHFKENDIGIAKITPCFENRKSVIFKDLINGCGAGTTELHILRIINQCIIGKYLLCLFKTDDFISAGISTFTGAVGQKRISTGFISNYPVPVPPMSEQKRIVEVIKKSFSYLDQISKSLS